MRNSGHIVKILLLKPGNPLSYRPLITCTFSGSGILVLYLFSSFCKLGWGGEAEIIGFLCFV